MNRRPSTARIIVGVVLGAAGGTLTTYALMDHAPTATPRPTSSIAACVEGIRADPMADTATTPGCIGLTEDEMIRAEAIALGTFTQP